MSQDHGFRFNEESYWHPDSNSSHSYPRSFARDAQSFPVLEFLDRAEVRAVFKRYHDKLWRIILDPTQRSETENRVLAADDAELIELRDNTTPAPRSWDVGWMFHDSGRLGPLEPELDKLLRDEFPYFPPITGEELAGLFPEYMRVHPNDFDLAYHLLVCKAANIPVNVLTLFGDKTHVKYGTFAENAPDYSGDDKPELHPDEDFDATSAPSHFRLRLLPWRQLRIYITNTKTESCRRDGIFSKIIHNVNEEENNLHFVMDGHITPLVADEVEMIVFPLLDKVMGANLWRSPDGLIVRDPFRIRSAIKRVVDVSFEIPPLGEKSFKKDSLNKRILNAITYLTHARTQTDATFQLASYIIAIEAMVGEKPKEKSGDKSYESLTELLADRVALLLEPSLNHRDNARAFFRDLYTARSNILHGTNNKIEHQYLGKAQYLASSVFDAFMGVVLHVERETHKINNRAAKKAALFLTIEAHASKEGLIPGTVDLPIRKLWH